ncbi:MAG: response regulator, partial [Desulfobaccales bacterium]
MACVLLVDGSEMARRAMHGILIRGGHRMAAVSTAQEAWKFVNEYVRVDLVITELKLPGGSGLAFVQRLKGDSFLKLLPVVIYAESGDREMVKVALSLKVQNILLKPYHDDAIYAEIAKAMVNPWRNRHFEEEKTFCQQMGYKPEELHEMLEKLRTQLGEDRTALGRSAEAKALGAVKDRLNILSTQAETAGAWGVVDYLSELQRLAEKEDWAGFQEKLVGGGVADWLIARHLDPSFMPEPFLSGQEVNAAHEEKARAIWFSAPAEGRCPVTDFPRLKLEIDALPGCPVLDSAAAGFAMNATGQPSSLNPLMDLVARDTGLAAQMLISASQLKRAEDFDPTPLEDPRLAVGRLGEVRLVSLARNLVTLEERHLNIPPHFSWPQYWIFQMGVARVARFTCHYLELYSMELQARMAGLLHDLGKLLLVKLHPFAFQAAVTYARD